MHRLCGLTVLAALVATPTGCALTAPGTTLTEDRPVTGVTAVDLATGGDLTVSRGSRPGLTITAGDGVLPRLTSDVHEGRLELGVDGLVTRLGDVRYELVVPVLDAVTVSGSGTARVLEPTTDHLTVTVSGSGDVVVGQVAADDLRVEISGSGAVRADGATDRLEVRISGSGGYEGADLDAEDATVDVVGSGSAEVRATGTLMATVTGSGRIRHTGGAQVTRHVLGSGAVTQG